ncbi:MAG: DNA polymerase IV [bacterium]
MNFRSLETQDSKPEPRNILHIDADAFFASVEQGFAPPLRKRPVIVGGSEDQRGVVHTASYDARKQGVVTGMPLKQAKQLVPDAVFLKGNFEHYKAVSRVFQQIYDQFTPVIEMTSLDDAYLDLSGTLKVHKKTPEQIARAIQQQIYDAVRVTVSCGIGTCKYIARIASGVNKPNGITTVPPGTELEFLHPLPVEALPGIGPAARERLHQLGIFTIGQLAAVPKAVLCQRFGTNGNKFWHLANGIDRREVKQRIIPNQISRETGFEQDVCDPDLVHEVLHYLTERIGKKLREDGLECQTVSVKVAYSDHKRYLKARTLPEATDSTDAIYRMVAQLLRETSFRRLRVRRVGLVVSNIERKNWQGELFSERTPRETLQGAIDDIRQRFGFTAILPASTINLQRHYRMEKSGYVLHAPALTR